MGRAVNTSYTSHKPHPPLHFHEKELCIQINEDLQTIWSTDPYKNTQTYVFTSLQNDLINKTMINFFPIIRYTMYSLHVWWFYYCHNFAGPLQYSSVAGLWDHVIHKVSISNKLTLALAVTNASSKSLTICLLRSSCTLATLTGSHDTSRITWYTMKSHNIMWYIKSLHKIIWYCVFQVVCE